MRHHYVRSAASAIALAALVASLPLSAAIQRTFVASTGSDANPCTLVQPCRSFTAAIAQTSAGGDIVVLDSAGYGGVTIGQSVNIIAPPGVYAGVTVFGGHGITVSGSGITVTLKGLTLNGTALNGINFIDGAELSVEDCTISGFAEGIRGFAPGARLVIRNTTIRKPNLYGVRLKGGNVAPIEVTISGVHVQDAGQYAAYIQGAVRAQIVDSTFVRAANQAIFIDPDLALLANRTIVDFVRVLAAESEAGLDFTVALANVTAEISLRDSEIAMNTNNGVSMNTSAGSGSARLSIIDTHIHHNGADGFSVQNPGGGVSLTVLTRNVITRNGDNGIFAGPNAVVRSAGDNRIDSNDGTEVLGTITTFGGV